MRQKKSSEFMIAWFIPKFETPIADAKLRGTRFEVDAITVKGDPVEGVESFAGMAGDGKRIGIAALDESEGRL
jgi:hypothetical protein